MSIVNRVRGSGALLRWSGLGASLALAGGCAPLAVLGTANFSPVTPFDVTISNTTVTAPTGAKLKRIEVWGEASNCSGEPEQPTHLVTVKTWQPPSVNSYTFSLINQDDAGNPLLRGSASDGYMVWIMATWKEATGLIDSGTMQHCFPTSEGSVTFDVP